MNHKFLTAVFACACLAGCGNTIPISQLPTPEASPTSQAPIVNANPSIVVNIYPSPSPSSINPGPFPPNDRLTSASLNGFYCVLDVTEGLVACSNQGGNFLQVIGLSNANTISLGALFPFCSMTTSNQEFCWGNNMMAVLQ